MSETEQIKACSELDGWSKQFVQDGYKFSDPSKPSMVERWVSPTGYHSIRHPDYSSRDVLIPLIEKQSNEVRQQFFYELLKLRGHTLETTLPCSIQISITHLQFADLILSSPSQLREALLRSVGKWTE